MHDVIIFLGPSLSVHKASEILSAEYRPPVRRVDLLEVIRMKPRIIGIIDGVFFEDAAVGHREVLEVMKHGITVVGASSMGALRAAELEPFGMIGIGEIFRMYREGIIESDDEVALMCDPTTNMAFSEALVNIRVTVHYGEKTGFFTSDESQSIISIGKSLWYPDRSWPRILQASSFNQQRKDEILAWVKDHAIDQKQEDARKALSYIKETFYT
ncbi:TfuA-related McrA-glycine thioamidation protein [Methanospirillum sp. J.3.6.1-F.2.7.3]|uniref:TfuA-related McrA-glycine thioamidation protein n=1 Tax=Methanospirillum purgamenti TaxID=2834276 RepID=A0A8E7EGL0_9EURY|nr:MULTISPECIES: TfuA-related McrA-glycine thioamidation protein [Methanospirillum]MDX8551550.1 TfuA-related McrA-glycine thioamidation protein [Methanospirillum hungatei]QVV87957.1 TfuA-related McrA-glycine thioamidation protein [Methanospirillum sp. J.3.6.1-F.2.7.3]